MKAGGKRKAKKDVAEDGDEYGDGDREHGGKQEDAC